MLSLVTPYQHWSDTKRIHTVFKLNISGVYTQGGDTLSFNVNNPSIKTGDKSPLFIEINNSTGWELKYFPNPTNPTLGNGLVKVFFAGVEISSGSYPSNLIADPNSSVYAIFKKYVDLG